MNRRGFLQSLAAGAAVIMLPSLAAETIKQEVITGVPATAAELQAWMMAQFACETAPATAFMEVPVEKALAMYGFASQPNDRVAYDAESGNPATVKYTHSTLAFGVEGDDPVEAERVLTQAMYEKFKELEKNTPILLRVVPVFSYEQVTEYGDTWMTREEIEDRVDIPRGKKETAWMMKTHDRHLVRWKFKPEFSPENFPPIDVPDNVEHDFETDSLRYVKRKYTLNKLRVRLSMPTMTYDEQTAFAPVCDGRKAIRV